MKSQFQMSGKYTDINVQSFRHPSLAELEAAFITKKPNNAIHFIKTWAMRKLKEALDSDNGQDDIEQGKQKKNEKKRNIVQIMRRRGAIVMAKFEQTQHWKQFYVKQKLPKNEQCKSRIMIGLRSVPFLYRFEWQDINHLVQLGEVRQYYRNQTFVSKGQMIDRIYILISGEIKRASSQGQLVVYTEGSYLFAEALISGFQANHNYTVISQKAWICGIEAYVIHERLKDANKKRQEYFERILMNVSLFNCLDPEEMYKLVQMVKELPPYKADQIVVHKDQPVSRLFLVTKGQFSLCRKNLSGDITALQNLHEGQFFDQEWIKTKTSSQVTVIAKTEGVLHYIDRESVEQGIAQIEYLILRKKMKKNFK